MARDHGLAQAEQFLAEREAAQERSHAVARYIQTAQLFAVSGRWYVRAGGYRRFPDEPPPGLTEQQQEIVARRIREGQSLTPSGKLPTIDWRRAQKLMGRDPS